VYLLDVTPRQVVGIAGGRLPERYINSLRRYRYGCGVFKIDWALSEPVPWTSAVCRSSATLHLGGTLDEIAHAEKQVDRGEYPDRPFVLFSQPSLFDSTRAPAGGHTAWAYCHVPHGSGEDMTEQIEAQVERFAPGFRDVVAGRSTMNTGQLQSHNPNLIGGDINGGRQDLTQLFTRPVARVNPYTTPDPKLFLCSSSTPPGGGVHGMCGYFAARAALKRLRARAIAV
ncbi:MAG: phytoene desaturase family protein, partial [Actinomycetota bacterium]